MDDTSRAPMAADTLVIALGGVDAFSPPVAFALACVRTAFAELGVRRVLLAFADRSSPCVTALEMALRARAIPLSCHRVQDGAWPEAVHLVAAGHIPQSPQLRSLFGFRDPALLHDAAPTGATKLFLGTDITAAYPANSAWTATPDQYGLCLAYAEGDIAITPAPPPPPTPDLSNPITKLDWAADDVGQTAALLHRPDGVAWLADAMARFFPNGPGRGIIGAVLAAIRDPAVPLAVVETDDSQAKLWLATIAAARAQRLGVPRANVHHLGTEYDFVATDRKPTSWSVWQWLGVLALRHIQPGKTVAAMLSTRNEGINLLEWVAHYRAIGVERIFIYTNANDDGSDDLLLALAQQNIITLVIQDCGPGIWAQRRALQHALLMLPELRQYAWVLFPDADEYTIPDARYDHRIAPLLAAADALPSQPGAILLPWRSRLWPHRFDRPTGMTLQNYPHAAMHQLFKSAVRPAVATSMIEIHFPFLDPGVTMVSSNLIEVPADAPWSKLPKSDAGGRVEHVWARSFTDFVIKRQRGFTGGLRDFSLFHKFNLAMTPENLWPIEALVIDRVSHQLEHLLAIPDIAAAAARVAGLYAARVAAIAADPALRAIFDAQPNPNGEQAG